MGLTFNRNYFALTLLLFIVEVLIACFVHDRFVRPYLGDALVVVLLYCFVRSFFKIGSVKLALAVLVFACVIELLQYVHLVDMLGLQRSRLVRTILGSYFEWFDVLAYCAGIAVVLILELCMNPQSSRS